MLGRRKITLWIIFTTLLLSVLLGGCRDNAYPELMELTRIGERFKVLDHLESQIWKGGLSSRDLSVLDRDDLSPATDPYLLEKVIFVEYLTLFSDFIDHLGSSTLNTLPEYPKSSDFRIHRKQSLLRMDIYRKFLLKLYRFEGEEKALLDDILRRITPYEEGQFKYMISELTLAYYKNIPELNGPTADDEPIFFTTEVDLGYTRGDKKMQTLINGNKLQLTDLTRHFFSQLTEYEMRAETEFYIKIQLLLLINKELLKYDKKGNLEGIQDVAIIKMQSFSLR